MSIVAKRIACCIPVALLLSCSSERAPSAETESHSDWIVHNQAQAVAQVFETLGAPEHLRSETTAKLVTLAEDNTPFLSEQIVGRQVWHVIIRKWKLRLDSAMPGFEDSYERTFDVLLDPEDGNILKIVSRWPEGIAEIAPEPSASSAELQMRGAGLEKYHSFPKTKPSISFLQALDVTLKEGFGNPLQAKQIVAHYVVRSSMERKPKRVWAITLRGITPFRAAYPGVAEDARNHMRNIIDATTGKWISANTSPQPESEP